MGVPKFFRYISERYPCLSEVVKEYQVPEFDNLYLDMNGIIHNCSHPDDNVHFRISEQKIFEDIFHYIECLFRMIKPQKLFFMAVDGVAPRAKMNQQRGRRFRSAKDAQKAEQKAMEKGEKLPDEARFDSNCITPGTVFMARLQEQLKYFVTNKISTDPMWKNCKVILSGHETPGEGEHKIMDYIRYLRAQPDHDPNTRHCLYGLDADLVMLGLCTHERHFSLLREEVKFGKKSNEKRTSVPEQINFFLLHLSLLREYLEMEFLPLKKNLSFDYDFEKIIDDWVLMGFLVGNDFIPHLPHLHIQNGALPIIYNAYMKALPKLGGYINEGGILNLERFEKFMEALSEIDLEHFSETYADLMYFESKTGRRPNEKQRTSYKPRQLEEWQPDENEPIIEDLLEAKKPMDPGLAALIKATDDMFMEPSEENLAVLAGEDLDDEDYDTVEEDDDLTDDDMFQAEFKSHKRDYYMNKLKYEQVTPEVMKSQAEGYIRAIQWNLHYYYNGVCSWSWYYPHHYAPYMTDIKGFSNMKMEFELGEPFKPYEQLLAVLPAASKALLPECYHELMTSEDSLIKAFYPEEFDTDLNGKKQEWEAVVLIPFIDEELLLKAMAPCNKLLTQEEVKRNTHGPMLVFQYSKDTLEEYRAPQYFPPIRVNHANCTPLYIQDIRVPIDKLVKGAYPGLRMDVFYPGFPTFKHLEYRSSLSKQKVKVFDQPSRQENMIVYIVDESEEAPVQSVAKQLLGKQIFVQWPHLVEALVIAVSDGDVVYNSVNGTNAYNVERIKNNDKSPMNWNCHCNVIVDHYKSRLGIEVGPVSVLVHVKVMTGRKYVYVPNQGRVNLEKQWSDCLAYYPLQSIVEEITAFEKDYTMYHDLGSMFPNGTMCFYLGHPGYGSLSEVQQSTESYKKGRVKILMYKVEKEPDFDVVRNADRENKTRYMSAFHAAGILSISRTLLSRITGSILVCRASNPNEDAAKTDIGLNLKHNKRNRHIPGYSKKQGSTWLYSEKTVDLVRDFMEFCPELFQYLSVNCGNDVFYEDEIFGLDNPTARIQEIVQWKKKQHYFSVEPQSCDAVYLEDTVVNMIEQVVDEFNQSNSPKKVTLEVKPDMLYKSTLYLGNILPDAQAKFMLYDRVINVREGYTVPLGLTGTIIGVNKNNSDKDSDFLYDIVFDKEFVGGLQLNCSPNKGYTLPAAALINRSHGQREFEKITGKPGELLRSIYGPSEFSRQPAMNSYPQQQNSAFASWNNQRTSIPPAQSYFQNQPKDNYYNQRNPNNQRNAANYNQYRGGGSQNNKNDFMPVFNKSGPQSQESSPSHNPKMTASQPFPGRSQNRPNHPYNSQKMSPHKQNMRREDFKYDQKNNKKEEKQITILQHAKPPTNNVVVPGESAKVPMEDVLKKMLKIGVSEEPAQVEQTKQDETKINLQDIFAHAKAQKQQHQQIPKVATMPKKQTTSSESGMDSTFYSMRLLSIYQAQGLGCPTYQYFTLPQGQFQAQVRTPNGKSMFGRVANTKQQACENVAEEVLKIMAPSIKKDSPPKTSSVPIDNFPTPPQQWRQSEGRPHQKSSNKPTQQYYSPPKSGKSEETAKPTESKTAAKSSAPTMFVPLQAVKHIKTAGNTTHRDQTSTKENARANVNSASSETNSQVIEASMSSRGEKLTNEKPKSKARKSRLAAVFPVPS